MLEEEKFKLLNSLLDAKWRLSECDVSEKADMMADYESLLDAVRAGRPDISRRDVERAIREPWCDYCRKKRKNG
jgi:hypothetical protein